MKILAGILAIIVLCAVGLSKPTQRPTPTPAVVTPAVAQVEVLDFYATWCGPCKANAAAIDRIEAEGYKITRIDVDQAKDRCSTYNIHSMPTYIVLRNGVESFRTHDPGELRANLHDSPIPPRQVRDVPNTETSAGTDPGTAS